MTRKDVILVCWCAALLAGIAAVPSSAVAASWPFYAIVGHETPRAEGPVWIRYYTTETDKINPAGAGACAGTWDPPYCEVPHTNKPNKNKVGYKGYLEDIFNYDGVLGNVYHAVWDTEFGAGTREHRGYYAWNARVVDMETSDPWRPDCSGDLETTTCLGNSNPDFAAGHEIEGTPLGTLEPWGGLLPMPVPRIQIEDEENAWVSWDPADGTGLAAREPYLPSYDLYYVVRDSSSSAPMADEYVYLRTVSGTGTEVTRQELGIEDCEYFFFALKIRFPSAAGREVVSRYLSANSAGATFCGNAAEVVDIQAKWLRRNQVQVSWATELEDGVRGFYVLRGYTPNGPFERVSDLVPANGEPSKYTYIDTIAPRGRVAASGLFYKIEAIDLDEGREVFGPAQAELPTPGGQHQVQRRGKHFRF